MARRATACCILGIASILLAAYVFISKPPGSAAMSSWSVEEHFGNSTFGFGNIYVLSMAKNLAKRDELALVSRASGMKWTILDAVDGRTLNKYSVNPSLDKARLNDGQKGCWRSHLDAWSKFLEDGSETALFLEDDADFGLDLRQSLINLREPLLQMSEIRTGVKYLNVNKPLPGDWQILWLGACREQLRTRMTDNAGLPFGVTYRDSNGPLPNETHINFLKIQQAYAADQNSESGYTRILIQSNFPWCTAAYALTRQGAINLLYSLTREPSSTIDFEMARKAKAGAVRSYVVVPPLFGQWKIKGTRNSDIDFRKKLNAGPVNVSEGAAENVGATFSVRHNLGQLISAM